MTFRAGDAEILMLEDGSGPFFSPREGVFDATPAQWSDADQFDPLDTVVLTHIHTDHIGWAVTGGVPFFPNARYLLQRADVEILRSANPGLGPALLEPLQEADRLDVVEGDTNLATGVDVVATPGHTPGHQSVLVSTGRERVLITGDLLVHAVQLLHPDVAYAHEVDPARAREARVRLLSGLSGGGVLATPHLSRAFVSI